MSTIFEALRADHDIQRELLKKLTATSGDSEERAEVFEELKKELECHADAEERFFYKPIIDKDLTQDKARHGIAEHHEIDELIEELEKTPFSSPGWLVTAKKLGEKVKHHLDEEEHEIFQMAGKVLPDNLKTSLAKDYESYMNDQRR